jgi:hypothetical protein
MKEEIFEIRIEIDGEEIASFKSEDDVKITFYQKDRGEMKEMLEINGHIGDAGQDISTTSKCVKAENATIDTVNKSIHIFTTKDKDWNWNEWYKSER